MLWVAMVWVLSVLTFCVGASCASMVWWRRRWRGSGAVGRTAQEPLDISPHLLRHAWQGLRTTAGACAAAAIVAMVSISAAPAWLMSAAIMLTVQAVLFAALAWRWRDEPDRPVHESTR